MANFSAAGGVLLVVLVINTIVSTNAAGNGATIGSISPTVNAPEGLTASGSAFAVSAGTVHLKDLQLTPVPRTSNYYFAGSTSPLAGTDAEVPVTRFPNEYGDSLQLEEYASKSLVIIFSGSTVITDFAYFGILDATLSRFIAGVAIPSGLSPPQPVILGTFRRFAHLVSAGDIVALDEKRIKINNFVYDGAGPDAFFYVGTGTPSENGQKVADENGIIDNRLGAYSGETITITLPGDVTIHDINWLSVWCILFASDFGSFVFPTGPLAVPPYLPYNEVQERSTNCVQLHDRLQVSWSVSGSNIMFELAGQIDSSEYMSFGLSGSDSRFQMIGADVVVADFRQAAPRAVDSYLSAYAQCDASGNGACPDTSSTTATNTNDVTDVSGSKENGITRVSYVRKLMTVDGASFDRSYTPGTPQQIVWGIGPLNTDLEAARHTLRITENKAIDFGRPVASNCPPFSIPASDSPPLPDFIEQTINATSPTVFTADIGNAGSTQGFTAITGLPSWGIAWWVNGVLIPRLTIVRGVKYTFSVAGGRDPSNPAKYHPFYITDSSEGGYAQKTVLEQSKERIYAGADIYNNPTGVGDYCEWRLKASEVGNTYSNIEDFTAAHEKICEGQNQGNITFTPNENTPDTLYYQCFTHKNLGFVIHIVNAADVDPFTTANPTDAATSANTPDYTMVAATTDPTGVAMTTNTPDHTATAGPTGAQDTSTEGSTTTTTAHTSPSTAPMPTSTAHTSTTTAHTTPTAHTSTTTAHTSTTTAHTSTTTAHTSTTQVQSSTSTQAPSPGDGSNGATIGSISPTVNAPEGLTASGSVFAISAGRFHLKDFQLTPVPRTSNFYFAGSTSPLANTNTEVTVTRFANEYGDSLQLEEYLSKSLVIMLPESEVVSNYSYFGVWDAAAKRFIAGVAIPSGLSPPQPVILGTFRRFAHGVASGDIVALDEKRIKINNLFYDGLGPDAFFYVGTGSPGSRGWKVADENNNVADKLESYSGETITITLPEATTIHDINWLSIWCIRFAVDFGSLVFPTGPLAVPPYLPYNEVQERSTNCVQLHDRLQVSWSVSGSNIMFELAGQIDSSEYMSFGLSGTDSRFQMIGADVVVADFRQAAPRAVDYYLSAYAQCDASGNGACPDTSSTTATNTNDVTDVGGSKENGITRVSYVRKLVTSDGASFDRSYTPGTPQQIVWGIGPLNTDLEAARHTLRITENKAIDFGRPVASNCPPFSISTSDSPPLPDFIEQTINATSPTVFTADIGNAGSTQGFTAITGLPSWGIAWWVNGVLIPRLTLVRGVKYTFSVAGGRDPSNPAEYHPFYITDSSEGGYAQKAPLEQSRERIYAGADVYNNPTGVGDYCEWRLKASEVGNTYNNIEDFTAAHEKICEGQNRGNVTFTPNENTPDTVYYQCFTHKNLGFVIHIVNAADDNQSTTPDPTGVAMTTNTPDHAATAGPTGAQATSTEGSTTTTTAHTSPSTAPMPTSTAHTSTPTAHTSTPTAHTSTPTAHTSTPSTPTAHTSTSTAPMSATTAHTSATTAHTSTTQVQSSMNETSTQMPSIGLTSTSTSHPPNPVPTTTAGGVGVTGNQVGAGNLVHPQFEFMVAVAVASAVFLLF